MLRCSLDVLRVFPENPGDGEQPGAEAAADGSGYLHEDGGLLFHSHFLWGAVQRGTATHSGRTERPNKLFSLSCALRGKSGLLYDAWI